MLQKTITELEFTRHDLGGPWECWRSAKYTNHFNLPWTRVVLPHCWNASDAVDPDLPYYEGAGWYRTQLEIDSPYDDGRVCLHFEGTGQRAQVYIHTSEVGSHSGGYDEWTLDITEACAAYHAQYGEGPVPLAIRCDNARDLETIPSDVSDFNLYGGIYRAMHLVYRPAIDWGDVRLEPRLQNASAELSIHAELSSYVADAEVELKLQLLNAQGEEVAQSELSLPCWQGERSLLTWQIDAPEQWHPAHPALYEVHLQLSTAVGQSERRLKTAFRHFEFVPHGPFMLNGERLLLRGTHRHEDHAGVAQAMTEAQIREEFRLMKEMGVNFIRLGHYQQSELVLQLCDELGILVWEEIPWCRGGLGSESYREMCRRMLRNMISQHRNHPSVIIWGLGNENDWPADFEAFDQDAIRDFMRELHELSHHLDPARKTAIRRCAFCADIVDVYSPSIWAGWYRGLYTEYKKAALSAIQEHQHVLHVEWGGDSHAGRHTEDSAQGLEEIQAGQGADEQDGDYFLEGGQARASKDTDWTETYFCDLVDWHLKEQETMPELTGAAQWPFKDFSTPVRPENPVPYMNQKGVLERDMTPKEGYYVFQSYWATKPMVHIYGHSWPIRWGRLDERKYIKVYSNCPEVELFLNGVSQGRRLRDSQNFPAANLRWGVDLPAGRYTLKAIGYAVDGTVEDELTQSYQIESWGAPASIRIDQVNAEDGLSTVHCQLVDAQGIPCLDAKDFYRFSLAGGGRLIDNQGTARASRRVGACNGRAQITVDLNQQQNVLGILVEGLEPCFVNLSVCSQKNNTLR
ncbi:glycoside hydrolase family 2 TIM barrel-domain containing protein [Coraliomargarita sp. SDUM461003]|uniref:Glycoside hydrolase family 2 TIM barrel-domain containing protein n=1 Tax=Thalassobacterium maritimum TaxID=3041265 RepID=A0ABU1AX04_9BACT|nr:glycoside hydrolase family 2 TIM barrel-domain containing protein [Coraliomargarita sp. SDUM461003]MDQ8207517.1 glycoside hydrolase family 2 TIM barrel-domain containing protein [Coraliomargarita sp. SDUM461003]